MSASPNLSVLSLITGASIPVQLVMLLLLLISIWSWTVIFRKWQSIGRAHKDTESFEKIFWSGGDLMTLYKQAGDGDLPGALPRIFESGMREFIKTRSNVSNDRAAMIDGARRAMRAAFQRELDALERSLPFLASAGSVSPYIGLFGTVWGIMHAFTGLSNVQQATLAAVAPGIAEALVATAIGLFAAIPAVVAYNRYATDIDHLSIRFEGFIEEFSNILQRQAIR
ncbi:MAG: protein TolQ [Burkholderiaceae bacterium]|nr:protein TolQ [Burkholderiaceae bacterium]